MSMNDTLAERHTHFIWGDGFDVGRPSAIGLHGASEDPMLRTVYVFMYLTSETCLRRGCNRKTRRKSSLFVLHNNIMVLSINKENAFLCVLCVLCG